MRNNGTRPPQPPDDRSATMLGLVMVALAAALGCAIGAWVW